MKSIKNDPALNKNVQLEVADILHLYGEDYRQNNPLSYKQKKVMHHIEVCRTVELGGHVEHCDQCDFERIAYNSCRDMVKSIIEAVRKNPTSCGRLLDGPPSRGGSFPAMWIVKPFFKKILFSLSHGTPNCAPMLAV